MHYWRKKVGYRSSTGRQEQITYKQVVDRSMSVQQKKKRSLLSADLKLLKKYINGLQFQMIQICPKSKWVTHNIIRKWFGMSVLGNPYIH